MPEPITSARIPVARLGERAPVAFAFAPDAEARAEIAGHLGLAGLRKARLEGTLTPERKRDWRLDAHLGATAVQSCVVTLAPVTTRIDTDVARTYLADGLPEPEGETEMPEDDTLEPLPAVIDLRALFTEALALALPDYPRAPGAGPVAAVFSPPGAEPLTDEETRPFAALRVLKGGAGDEDEN